MRGIAKKALYVSLATACSIILGGCLTRSSKEWINDRIKQDLVQYEQKDRQWTRERLLSELRLSEQINEEKFETRVPLEQLIKAFDSTYKIVNEVHFETREGKLLEYTGGLGSGILLKGGYLLTAKHVVDENFVSSFSEQYWGLVKYHHNELSIDGKHKLKKIFFGQGYDYALLKLEEDVSLPSYGNGLNLPNEVKPGIRSAAIGYSLGRIKNVRLGNVSQIESDAGEEYLTFKNSIIPGDSGGPLFVIEDGEIKLTALTCLLSVLRDWNVEGVLHPTNIGYGLKLETIIEDMERNLMSGGLDEETTGELSEFLELNKK